MIATATGKSLKQLVREIAQALEPDWKLSNRFDLEDSQDRRPWRSHIEGPGSQALFLSNTWGPKGMLHVAGWTPDAIDHHTQVSVGTLPSRFLSPAEDRAKISPVSRTTAGNPPTRLQLFCRPSRLP